MPLTSASDSSEEPGHHVHYGHHEHFQQDIALPHYKDLLTRGTDKVKRKSCGKNLIQQSKKYINP